MKDNNTEMWLRMIIDLALIFVSAVFLLNGEYVQMLITFCLMELRQIRYKVNP